ncbi:MAG: site-specific integrase, partial [Deltaproteobacteria bacterium]|nr:site-specific integrase [Deltaproteobacteria bacterium]
MECTEPLVREYLEHIVVERGLSLNTVSAYGRDLLMFAGSLKRKNIGFIGAGPDEITGYIRELMEGGLSARSYTRALITLRGFYRFLLRKKRIKESPCDIVDIPRFGMGLPDFLSVEELDRLLAAPDAGTVRG